MFVCRACAKRWRGPPSALFVVPGAVGRGQLDLTTASFSTAVATATRNPRPRQQQAMRSLGTTLRVQAASHSATKTHAQTRDEDDTATATAASSAANRRLNSLVKQRLRYLQSPYTIAEAVAETLGKGKYEEALHLTRVASKDHDVVVSWNHLIAYTLREDKLTDAIKLYNEMKKRAQLPNAYTYTVIFRGCAKSQHSGLAVHHATRLYHSMLASERFQPSTIHMNAVLQVCARAKDTDSLFSIAMTADGRVRIPDNLTYTTVLNGLRFSTALPHHRPNQRGNEKIYLNKEMVATSVARARAVWDEVVTNWRNGIVMLDEELVCAMGRVLLMGDHNDNNDVLSLVEQTTGIPRLDRETQTLAAPKPASEDTESETTAKTDAGAAVDTAKPPMPPRVTQFDTVDASAGNRKKAFYVQPGRNTLSLIQTSLGATKKTTLATRYWDILTSPPYDVVPDSENWYRMLRALRRGHASKKMAEMMEKMPCGLLEPKTFQLAMATCAADNLNDHVFASAGKILDLMVRTLREPDPYTMRMYLQTAVTNNRRFRSETDPVKREAAKFAFGQQLVRALGRLWDPLRRAGNVLSYPGRPFASPAEQEAQTYNARRELMALARQMVSAADMVVTEGMADDATIKDMRTSRNLLNRQITRFYENREEIEPNLKKGKRGQRDEKDRKWEGQKDGNGEGEEGNDVVVPRQ